MTPSLKYIHNLLTNKMCPCDLSHIPISISEFVYWMDIQGGQSISKSRCSTKVSSIPKRCTFLFGYINFFVWCVDTYMEIFTLKIPITLSILDKKFMLNTCWKVRVLLFWTLLQLTSVETTTAANCLHSLIPTRSGWFQLVLACFRWFQLDSAWSSF